MKRVTMRQVQIDLRDSESYFNMADDERIASADRMGNWVYVVVGRIEECKSSMSPDR